jgi:hypothetical protein
VTLEDRIRKYTERGFQRAEAEILVLIEETAVAIFTAFPDRFIIFGGATLVLFYYSPRFSRDLDLLASPAKLPTSEEIVGIVRARIQPVAETFGLGQLEFRNDRESADFVKQWVIANQNALFSIDLTRIGGNVLESHLLKKTIAGTPPGTVLAPTANFLLLQKCETFLDRRYVKARDAFDIHLLVHQGAALDEHLLAHLEDFTLIKELDREFIVGRIEKIIPKLCTVELRAVLPLPVFEELAQKEFEAIRHSLRTVFSPWLGEAAQ